MMVGEGPVPEGAKVIDAVVDGVAVRFCVADPADKIQGKHARGKFWEREEMAVMAAHMPAGGVFCDIGANVGNHTLFALLFMGAGRVIAFEPNPVSMALLRANVALNGLGARVDLMGYGLSDAAGEGLSMVTKRANLGATRLVADGQGAVPVRTGDAMLAGTRVDFIKLDVEGMEMQALRGLSATIATCRPPIFLELDHTNAQAFRDWTAAQDYIIAHEGPLYPANQDLLVLPKEKKNA